MISDYSVFDVLEFLTAQAVTCQNSQVVLFGINWVLLYDIHTFFHKMYDTGYVVVVCSVFEEDFEFGSWEEAREVV